MEMAEQQQQPLHGGVLDGIARLEDPRYREESHKLIVDGLGKPPVNRYSLRHLVDFLDNDGNGDDSREVVIITELKLEGIQLIAPSDGGLNVLTDFFARSDTTSDTTLTKVYLQWCNFGTAEDASQLLAAFHTNRTISELTIHQIRNLYGGATIGTCLSGLLQNMPQLQRLDCTVCALRVQGVRAFQPALQANLTLRELNLWACEIGDEGIRLIADALAGNTIMEVLDISYNDITSIGLADITRLLESTQLKTIKFKYNEDVFDDEDATQHFVTTLQHKNSSVQELPMIGPDDFPGDEDSKIVTFFSVNNSLKRNQQLNRVDLLLAPPPPQQQQNHHGGAAMMMFKTWHKAITKFAMVRNNAGASAIFKLFKARPQLLEKRLKRPAAGAAAAAAAVSRQQLLEKRLKRPGAAAAAAATSAAVSQEQKRRRLL